MSKTSQNPDANTKESEESHIVIPNNKHASDYEMDIEHILAEKKKKLKELKSDPMSTKEQLSELEEEIQTLDSLHENYDEGMNVFRQT